MAQTNWQRTRDILINIICIGIILWAVWNIGGQFVDAIVLLLLSLAVAFLLTPAVNMLVKYRVSRTVACLVAYIVVLAALVGFGYVLASSLIRQILSFSTTIQNYVNALPGLSTNAQKFLRDQGIPQATIDVGLAQIRGYVTTFATSVATNILNLVFVVTGAIVNIVIVLVLSFYFTLDGKRIRNSIISIVPQRSMPHVLVFEDALNRVVGNYIRGQLTLALIIGILSGIVCVITGLRDYAIIVGVLAFIFETIPMVGPALASIPAIGLSLLLPDPFPRTAWVVVCFVVIQMLESNILGPRIVGHAVGLHPVASLLALLVFAKLFGAFGALLATPIVAASWVVIVSIYRSARGETADQMLARKRAPWTIRRPTDMPTLRGRRRTQVLHDGRGGSGSRGGVSIERSEEREVPTVPKQRNR